MNESERAAALTAAKNLAGQAVTVSGGLEAGTYEAVQALALASIAQSLSVIAESTVGR